MIYEYLYHFLLISVYNKAQANRAVREKQLQGDVDGDEIPRVYRIYLQDLIDAEDDTLPE